MLSSLGTTNDYLANLAATGEVMPAAYTYTGKNTSINQAGNFYHVFADFCAAGDNYLAVPACYWLYRDVTGSLEKGTPIGTGAVRPRDAYDVPDSNGVTLLDKVDSGITAACNRRPRNPHCACHTVYNMNGKATAIDPGEIAGTGITTNLTYPLRAFLFCQNPAGLSREDLTDDQQFLDRAYATKHAYVPRAIREDTTEIPNITLCTNEINAGSIVASDDSQIVLENACGFQRNATSTTTTTSTAGSSGGGVGAAASDDATTTSSTVVVAVAAAVAVLLLVIVVVVVVVMNRSIDRRVQRLTAAATGARRG